MSRTLNLISRLAIPAAVGVSIFQLSIYDVKGGTRAVIFDRLTGVKEKVCLLVFEGRWGWMKVADMGGTGRQ